MGPETIPPNAIELVRNLAIPLCLSLCLLAGGCLPLGVLLSGGACILLTTFEREAESLSGKPQNDPPQK